MGKIYCNTTNINFDESKMNKRIFSWHFENVDDTFFQRMQRQLLPTRNSAIKATYASNRCFVCHVCNTVINGDKKVEKSWDG